MPLPRLRDDVRINREGPEAFSVRGGAGHEALRLAPPGLWLLLRLDGASEPGEVLAAYEERFGEPLPREELDRWIAELDAAGLLVRDHRAAEVLALLARHDLRHRRPGPERREEERGPGRREGGNRSLWFDRALFLLNEGEVEPALEILDAFVDEDPASVRLAELADVLRAWLSGRVDERRDGAWRAFDRALEGLLRRATCPACAAPFEVRPGTNRCEACGRSFSSWLLEHPAQSRRSE